MAAPTFNFKITTPFAKNGIRQTVPETSGTTEMSYDQGYTAAYQQPPAEGGRFIEMSKFNELFYRIFAAVQELQDILVEGDFTVAEAVKARVAETANKLAGLLGIAGGGTGADNATQARVNLGLGNVDNTSDMDKPISNAVQAALNGKQPAGNYQPAGDYATTAALNSGLAGKANTVHTQGWDTILNKPNIPTGGIPMIPSPTTWWNQTTASEGTSVTIPAGGTWAVHEIRINNTGNVYDCASSIVAGGHVLQPTARLLVFAWRIQ